MITQNHPAIAIVDPDTGFQQALSHQLETLGLRAVAFASAESYLREAFSAHCSLIVSEVALPSMTGFELCRMLTESDRENPVSVVLVSLLNREADRWVGFSVGATDFVVKPCSVRELALRVRAIARRMRVRCCQTQLVNGPLFLDTIAHRVWCNQEQLRLSRIEFKLVHLFLRSAGTVLSRRRILEEVWGDATRVNERTVDAHVRILRTKLKEAAEDLETVQGAGYRLCPREDRGEALPWPCGC
jgi:two-component system phosphate regulon response regulator PhoB